MATEKITDSEFFHVTRDVPYNHHSALTIGSILEAGSKQNPFFGFYENVLTYQVSLSQKLTNVRDRIGTVSIQLVPRLKRFLVERRKLALLKRFDF